MTSCKKSNIKYDKLYTIIEESFEDLEDSMKKKANNNPRANSAKSEIKPKTIKLQIKSPNFANKTNTQFAPKVRDFQKCPFQSSHNNSPLQMTIETHKFSHISLNNKDIASSVFGKGKKECDALPSKIANCKVSIPEKINIQIPSVDSNVLNADSRASNVFSNNERAKKNEVNTKNPFYQENNIFSDLGLDDADFDISKNKLDGNYEIKSSINQNIASFPQNNNPFAIPDIKPKPSNDIANIFDNIDFNNKVSVQKAKPLNNYNMTGFSDIIFHSFSSISKSSKIDFCSESDDMSVSSENNDLSGERKSIAKKVLCKYCGKYITTRSYIKHLFCKHKDKLTLSELYDCFDYYYDHAVQSRNKAKKMIAFFDAKKLDEAEKNNDAEYIDIAKKIKIINSFKVDEDEC